MAIFFTCVHLVRGEHDSAVVVTDGVSDHFQFDGRRGPGVGHPQEPLVQSIREDADLDVTPESIRRQIDIIERARRQAGFPQRTTRGR